MSDFPQKNSRFSRRASYRDALAPDDQAVWERIAAVRIGVRGPWARHEAPPIQFFGSFKR
jgi:hypothetical protein